MKKLQNKEKGSYLPKMLALSVSALMASMTAMTTSQASDIEIYQDAKKGDVTLMFMLDVSGSMSSGDDGQTGSRWQRVQIAMRDLLSGNTSRGIERLGDDKIIGLSTLGGVSFSNTGALDSGSQDTGAILVPARRLDASVTVDGTTKTQRQLLLDRVNRIVVSTNTPTAKSYAETIAYLMGTSTQNLTGSGWNRSHSSTKSGSNYSSPASLTQSDNIKSCSGQGIYVLTDGQPNQNSDMTALAKSAIGRANFSCTASSDGWDCTNRLNESLINPALNAKNLKFKTAVVGFGNAFNSITSFDKAKTQAQNIAALGTIDSHEKRAARWGILGEGGWYSGNSSQDVVDSVNAFIDSLSTDIPSVTTGAPAIPIDILNPSILQKHAYYQQFQPTPNLTHQLWLGNLKKFNISNTGKLQGKSNADVTDAQGRLITPTYNATTGNISSAVYDLWAENVTPAVENSDEETIGSRKFAAKGGVWSKLKLGESATVANSAARKVLTNRKSTDGTTFSNSGTLQQVNLDYITNATYKTDPSRGHLVSLLGYKIDITNIPTTVNNLKLQPSLRQMGAPMHSIPLLLTTEGTVSYNTTSKKMESSGRKDYTLFGTTQGLLHVVDADTGEEKFAFVPNEMVENQRDAFSLNTLTTGGLRKLYYGIDAPWSVYSEYVVDGTGKLTVGSGKGTQQGVLDVYGGLRMGGRSYYALDLKNMNSPSLKFHINPADKKIYRGSVVSAEIPALGFMGQSWSKPSITWINWGGTRKKVMFVGGGYDAGGVDGDTRVTANGAKGAYAGYEGAEYNQTNKIGAGVYMFDAENGDLLWWTSDNVASTTSATTNSGVIGTKDTNLKYSVVSEIRTVDRNGDDLVDHIYFGDLGGQLFRVDFDNTKKVIGAVPKEPVRLLNLNADSTGKSPRFYDMPGFSLYDHNGTNFAAISIGSGNRSEPLKDYTATDNTVSYNAIYNIYDKDVARKDLFTATSLTTRNLGLGDLGEITDTNRSSNTNLVAAYPDKQGWYYQYNSCNTTSINPAATNICSNYKKQSEKVFGTPLAMNFKLYVSTFDASKPGMSGDCGAGVKGESYASTFCMPYGQCDTPIGPGTPPPPPDIPLGFGIQTIVIGPKCEGPTCGSGGGTTGNKEDFNAVSYCVANDGRSAFGSIGAFGEGVSSRICLTPQRWYEQVGKI